MKVRILEEKHTITITDKIHYLARRGNVSIMYSTPRISLPFLPPRFEAFDQLASAPHARLVPAILQ